MTRSADLALAARLLRTLSEAEVARLEGDFDRVEALLDSVDPVDANRLASSLRRASRVERFREAVTVTRPRSSW